MTEIADQPPPTPNGQPAVWDLVIADMRERDQVGRERYSTPLQPFNGRDALVDAYQEALDLVAYLRQAIAERDDGTSPQCPARARGTTGEVRCIGPTDHQGKHASWDGTGILMRWPDETSVAPDGVHKCPRCGSMKWVGVSLDGGRSRRAQCVPCGHVHARLRHDEQLTGQDPVACGDRDWERRVTCVRRQGHQGNHGTTTGGALVVWPDETPVATDGVHECPRCGSTQWVGISLGGFSRRAQCVPCGHVHARLRHVAAVSGVAHPWCERCQMTHPPASLGLTHPTTSSGQG